MLINEIYMHLDPIPGEYFICKADFAFNHAHYLWLLKYNA